MPFTNVYNALEEIAAAPGNNDKLELLKRHLTDPTFAKVCQFMLSEDMTYNIKELPVPSRYTPAETSQHLFETLKILSMNKGASNADKMFLAKLAGDGPTREVVQRIVTKDPRAGFGLSSAVKVAPDLFFQTPYQRCSGADKLERIQLPGIIQKKADGMFCYVSPGFNADLSNHSFLTRKGKSFHLLGELQEEIEMYCSRLSTSVSDPVLVGELNMLELDGSVMPRKKSNGILNKFIKGTGSLEEAQRVVYNVWDALSGAEFRARKSDRGYRLRWGALVQAFDFSNDESKSHVFMKNLMESGIKKRVRLIESEEAADLKEAKAFYDKMRSQGEEGAILKDYSSTWKNGTSTTMAKMKHFAQAEFRITGAAEGKGRLADKMGALEVESEDGVITCSVGSGFSDDQRDLEYWLSKVGQIVTLQFESVISDKRTGKKSLFIPTFVESRFNEKTTADTVDYIEGL